MPVQRDVEKRAPKVGKAQQDHWKGKIADSGLINRLINHAMGNLTNPMEPTQVTVSLKLLDKILPSLKAVDVDANVDGNMTVQIVRFGDTQNPE